MRDGECSEPTTSAPLTSASGSGSSLLYPTPSTPRKSREGGNLIEAVSARAWPTPTAGDAKSSGSRRTPTSRAHDGLSLTDAIRGDGGRGRSWPTPAARDGKGGGQDGQLPTHVPGALNPRWVEWLMNWPIGWCSLEPLAEAVTLPWTDDPADREADPIPRAVPSFRGRPAQLRALGNGQVPACAVAAWRSLT
jgi:hypothetical protein